MKTLIACISFVGFSLCALVNCSFSSPTPNTCDLSLVLANGVNLVRELPVDWASASDLRITTCEQNGSEAPECVTEEPSAAITADDGGPDADVDGGTSRLVFGDAPFAVGSGFLSETPDGKTELSMFLVSGEPRRGQRTQLTVTVRDTSGVELMTIEESVQWSDDECAPFPDRKDI